MALADTLLWCCCTRSAASVAHGAASYMTGGQTTPPGQALPSPARPGPARPGPARAQSPKKGEAGGPGGGGGGGGRRAHCRPPGEGSLRVHQSGSQVNRCRDESATEAWAGERPNRRGQRLQRRQCRCTAPGVSRGRGYCVAPGGPVGGRLGGSASCSKIELSQLPLPAPLLLPPPCWAAAYGAPCLWRPKKQPLLQPVPQATDETPRPRAPRARAERRAATVGATGPTREQSDTVPG